MDALVSDLVNILAMGLRKVVSLSFQARRFIYEGHEVTKEIQSFFDVAEAVEEETLVFTKKKRPVAGLVSLRNVDRESLALSTTPQFLKIIEIARKEVRAGKTISLKALEKKYGVKAPNKRLPHRRHCAWLGYASTVLPNQHPTVP